MIHINEIVSQKKLPLNLKRNGFDYTQVLLSGDCYIYKQDYNSAIEHNEPGITPEIIYYEVFRAKVRPNETIYGKHYPAREVFPRDEDFGKTAWSMRELDRAIDKLMKLKGYKS
jgi:hypothetical protein